MIFSILPRSLVKVLIQQYEYYDIGLDRNEEYFELKNKVLEHAIIPMRGFCLFIERTRRIHYTVFRYNNFPAKIRSLMQKMIQTKTAVVSEVKFDKIQYIKFLGFDDIIYKKIKDIINHTSYDELILDLRDNTGGKLDFCLKIIDLLVPATKILTVEGNHGSKDYYSDDEFKSFQKIYILVNEYTASCSEIVCMVLKKRLEHVYIIGNKSSFKRYTQHVIYNKFYGYRFAITDGIWNVDNEIADDLYQYLCYRDKKLEVLDDYMECIRNIT